jgi:hypothetical protein
VPDLTGKLGKDGKLTDEERKRCMDNHLCLFCAAAGHYARDCPGKSTSRVAKARAATTTSAPKQEAKPVASSEAKK